MKIEKEKGVFLPNLTVGYVALNVSGNSLHFCRLWSIELSVRYLT